MSPMPLGGGSDARPGLAISTLALIVQVAGIAGALATGSAGAIITLGQAIGTFGLPQMARGDASDDNCEVAYEALVDEIIKTYESSASTFEAALTALLKGSGRLAQAGAYLANGPLSWPALNMSTLTQAASTSTTIDYATVRFQANWSVYQFYDVPFSKRPTPCLNFAPPNYAWIPYESGCRAVMQTRLTPGDLEAKQPDEAVQDRWRTHHAAKQKLTATVPSGTSGSISLCTSRSNLACE